MSGAGKDKHEEKIRDIFGADSHGSVSVRLPDWLGGDIVADRMKGGKGMHYAIGIAVMVLCLLIVGHVLFAWTIMVEAAQSQKEEWEDYIEIIAADYNICPELVEAVIERESSWRPDAVNGSCIGLMQINPEYHAARMERLGVENLLDPYDNILVGTDFLAELFWEYGDIYAVLMYYNAGYDGLRAWRAGEYSDYTVKVAERSAELERTHGK